MKRLTSPIVTSPAVTSRAFIALAGAALIGSLLAAPPLAAHAIDTCADPADVIVTTQTGVARVDLGPHDTEKVLLRAWVREDCGVQQVRVGLGRPGGEQVVDLTFVRSTGDGLALWHGWLRLQTSRLDITDAGSWTTDFRVDGTYPQHEAGEPLQVTRRATLTVNGRPEPVRSGGTLVLTGTLKRAQWDRGGSFGYRGKRVQVLYREPERGDEATTYRVIKTIRSGPGGKLRTTVTAPLTGSYTFAYEGNAVTSPARARGDYIVVR